MADEERPINPEEIRKEHKKAITMTVMFIIAVLSYIVIAEVIKMSNAPFKGFVSNFQYVTMLEYLFIALSVLVYPVSKYIGNAILSGKFSIQVRGGNSNIKLNKLFQVATIKLALFEVPAVFGLLIFFISGKSLDLYLFIAITVAYYILEFPKYTEWENYVKKR